MATGGGRGRTDSASRLIKAPPHIIYQALVDPAAVAAWRPPAGMHAEIHAFEAREGGLYKMALIYDGTDPNAPHGKTSENVDLVEGRFHELRPNDRVVEIVTFSSEDPAFAGAMTITTALEPAPNGTKVTITCENVPAGISASDHEVGLASTLANLAAFAERRIANG